MTEEKKEEFEWAYKEPIIELDKPRGYKIRQMFCCTEEEKKADPDHKCYTWLAYFIDKLDETNFYILIKFIKMYDKAVFLSSTNSSISVEFQNNGDDEHQIRVAVILEQNVLKQNKEINNIMLELDLI